MKVFSATPAKTVLTGRPVSHSCLYPFVHICALPRKQTLIGNFWSAVAGGEGSGFRLFESDAQLQITVHDRLQTKQRKQ